MKFEIENSQVQAASTSQAQVKKKLTCRIFIRNGWFQLTKNVRGDSNVDAEKTKRPAY